MARRGENIYKRKDGRWEGRIPVENHVNSNKVKYQYFYARNYRELKNKMRQSQQTKDACDISERQMTYGEWLKAWMEKYYQPGINIKESTLAEYVFKADAYLLPELGEIKIAEMTRSQLQTFFNRLLSGGKGAGSGLSLSTVQSVYSILRLSLSHCKELRENPCDKIVLPKKRRPEMRVLSREEQAQLEARLAYSIDVRAIGIWICLYAGLRVGELCALTWRDINLEERWISVRNTLQRVANISGSQKSEGTKLLLGRPKSVYGERRIPITSVLYQRFSAYAEGQPKHLKGKDCYVISKPDKTPYEPRAFQRYFHKLTDEAGIPDANFHCLRHTFATRAAELDIDVKTLQELLGHAQVETTLTYIHSMQEHKIAEMGKFDKIDSICRQNRRQYHA